jgi:outer membrane protein assembly factor BamE (lipoprotein component of BamABCDE complex)
MNLRRMLCALAAASALAGCATYTAGPVRDDALFAAIHPGMTREDVLRIAGPPDQTMPFPLSRTVAWDYRAYDTWGYLVEQSVTFDADGRVVSRFARRINDGGDHGK